MDDLKQALWIRLLDIPGVEEGENSWGDDRALWVNAKQMANFQDDGTLEIRLTRPVIRELKPRLKDDARVIRVGGRLRLHRGDGPARGGRVPPGGRHSAEATADGRRDGAAQAVPLREAEHAINVLES